MWFNEHLREIRDRLSALVAMNRSVLMPKSTVTNFKVKYRSELARAKREANDRYINQASNPHKAMWQIIKNCSPKCPPKTSHTLDAESLNNFFTNVAEEIVKDLPQVTHDFQEYMRPITGTTIFTFREVTFLEVRQIINKLKNKNSTNCYGMNSKIIKNIKNIILYPLTKLINLYITNKIFPSILKTAKIVPIFKNKGKLNNASEYRPISILPIFAKIFEMILKDQMYHYLEQNAMLIQCQFGFRSKKSTTLAIDALINQVSDGFERFLDTYASFFDLTKAFDCVSHDVLLQKLTIILTILV